jgi:polyprenyl P-hydroxybenzoate/phenylacrylic acid decarboxylase-like protein
MWPPGPWRRALSAGPDGATIANRSVWPMVRVGTGDVVRAEIRTGDDDEVWAARDSDDATCWRGEMSPVRRLVVGLSGSSAPQLGVHMLRVLQRIDEVESHLVLSAGSLRTIDLEMGIAPSELRALADVSYEVGDMAAAISSGSFLTMGMVVIPCSMRTLGALAAGVTGDLVTRAADVCLKERRRLVLVPRETPLNLIHIRNMETLTLAGATILPPMPAFYHHPKTIDDLLDQLCGKVLDQFQIEHDLFDRWK